MNQSFSKAITPLREMRSQTFRVLRNLTVSKVFWISGIFSFRPAFRLCVLTSMNWYFLIARDVQPLQQDPRAANIYEIIS